MLSTKLSIDSQLLDQKPKLPEPDKVINTSGGWLIEFWIKPLWFLISLHKSCLPFLTHHPNIDMIGTSSSK
jgi:hypothetical protein